MVSVKRKALEGGEKAVIIIKSDEKVVTRRAVLVLSVVGFFGSMFFWSQNITGNVVLGFEKASANWIGGVLFVLAMTGFLVYVQKRKK